MNWLTHRGSLTQRLRDLTGGQIELRLNKAEWGMLTLEEASQLSLQAGDKAWIREITWAHNDEAWVEGRVAIPESSTTGEGAAFLTLKANSIGDLLKTDPKLSRGEFQLNTETQTRSSVFTFHNLPLLVTEQFLPAFFAYVDA